MDARDILRSKGIVFDDDFFLEVVSRYKIEAVSVFGSVLREDFQDDSDIDLLIRFVDGSHISLFDLADIETVFRAMFGRTVDLVEEDALTNPYRRRAIMNSRVTLYAA